MTKATSTWLSYAAVLEAAEYSKPWVVLSDYPGHIVEERAEGRFHGSIGFRRSLCERIGGWPETLRADFDQQMLARLEEQARSVGDPCALAPPQYVFRWHTGHWHGQGAMRGPVDEGVVWAGGGTQFKDSLGLALLHWQADHLREAPPPMLFVRAYDFFDALCRVVARLGGE